MKHTITKSDKNIKILNQLIANGFYKGHVETEKFELMPNRWPNNYCLIGILNNDQKYDLKFEYKTPINIAAKFLLLLGILVSIFFLLKGNWMLAITFVVFGLILLTNFKLKEEKKLIF